MLFAAGEGLLDTVAVEQLVDAERSIRQALLAELPELARRMEAGADLSDEDDASLRSVLQQAVADSQE